MGLRHALLGHYPAKPIGFDGASPTAPCAECGLRLLQDSQGNWFAS